MPCGPQSGYPPAVAVKPFGNGPAKPPTTRGGTSIRHYLSFVAAAQKPIELILARNLMAFEIRFWKTSPRWAASHDTVGRGSTEISAFASEMLRSRAQSTRHTASEESTGSQEKSVLPAVE